ncbi:MAG: hypothetical protein ACKOFA_02940, partial [Rhodoluna sp.]
MKKNVIIVSISLVAVLALFYGTVQAKTLAPGMKVAVLVSYSGPVSFTSTYQRVGIELAAADLQGKASVSASYFDAGDTDNESKAVAQKIKSLNPDLVLAPLETD